jgi:nicotinate phosphoribosyltransferase
VALAVDRTRPDRSLIEGVLFTDQYQLTMSQAYFRQGLHERTALFEHFFRRYPDYGSHQAGYCIAAGMDWLLDWMTDACFGDAEIAALAAQRSPSGAPVFDRDFLTWLRTNGSFEGITMRAVPEGRVVHANAPVVMIEGPLVMAQILETALLNHLNFQTLIATKASRVAEASRGQPVLEFGLRRSAHFGGNAAGRAALIGGAVASSNVGLSHAVGIEPRGTHAHSMVQAFMALGEGELGAFRSYAQTYPDDCLLLVDTIDTLASGVPNAITVFDELRAQGHEPVGIRLDSGDLAYLAIKSAELLNDAGYADTRIVLSSGLDELAIFQILAQIDVEAPRYGIDPKKLISRLVMGVGSKLSASQGQAYLDGVYKLVAITDGGQWKPAIKVSETPSKTANPGDKDLYRLYDERGRSTADLMAIRGADAPTTTGTTTLRHPVEPGTQRVLRANQLSAIESLLEPVMIGGRRLHAPTPLADIRERRRADLDRLDPGVRRLVNPHRYHVSLSEELWELKQQLLASLS